MIEFSTFSGFFLGRIFEKVFSGELWVDFGGEIGERKSSAQITQHYQPEQLVGRQVIAVVNFPTKQIGPFMSEFLTLGLHDDDGNVVLVAPDKPVPNGARLA